MNRPARPLLLVVLLALAACGVAPERTAVPTAPPLPTVPVAVVPPSTALPTRTPSPAAPALPPADLLPSATPTASGEPFDGFFAYRVKAGDTLMQIAERGGSTVAAISSYNRLPGPPQVGRELIVPRLAGRPSSLPAKWLVVERGNTTKPWVALTLDCGGRNQRTHDLLKTLRDEKIRLTFFLLGESIIEDPALLRQMVADGHELASHSYTHADFTTLSDAQINDELRRTERAVAAIIGPEVAIRPYFRFPYGAYDRRTLQTVINAGYMPVHWTLDSLDQWGEPKTPEFIVERFTTQLSNEELSGAILLSHCTGVTADALPGVIKGLRARGFELRTLSEVLGP